MIKKCNALVAVACIFAVTSSAELRPNVIIIYGDDVGYGDVGAYGSTKIPTPNIDQLAKQGLMFIDGHCSASTCTPSRYSMLTGIHGFREKISILPPDAPLCISTDVLTLPKLFKQVGYRTAVIGKWHLGLGRKGIPVDWNGKVQPGPLELGFDRSFLLPSTNDRVPCVYLDGHRVANLRSDDPLYVGESKADVDHSGGTTYPDGKQDPEAMTYYKNSHGHNESVINGIGRIGYMAGGQSALWNDETMADVFVDQAKRFIASNMDHPFFLYFASQDIHVPRAPNPRFHGRTDLSCRGDAMVQLDWATGEIMKALDDHGLATNTIVIFTSDNGPVYDDGYEDGSTVYLCTREVDRGHDASGVYRGGKYQIYEGGTRVPFIVSWPGRILPGTSDAMVNQIDFIASFAQMLDIDLKSGDAPDSRNTLKAFFGGDSNGLDYMVEEAFGLALRVGEWKYVEPQRKGWGSKVEPAELYNLNDDPSESSNIIDKYPGRALQMANQLEQIKTSIGVR